MFSGKTEELIRQLTRAKIAGKRVVAFKPNIDTRYGQEILASHSGIKIDCRTLDASLDNEMVIPTYFDVVGFDEAQFFSSKLIGLIGILQDQNVKVLVAGLDMTYRREPFGPMPILMAVAEEVSKLKAVCHVCGEDAAYTQRLIDGIPASFSGPTVEIGALDKYEARCYYCYETD
jgi:thymidine kinase